MNEKILVPQEGYPESGARIPPLVLVWSAEVSEPEPDQEHSSEPDSPESLGGKPRLKSFWVVSAISILKLAYTCLVLLGTSVALVSLSGCTADLAEAEAVIDAYMKAMARKDVGQALALFTADLGESELRLSLEAATDGANFAAHEGYERTRTYEATIGVQGSSEPNDLRGIVGQVSGEVIYSDGYTGTFDAVLVKADGVWKLYSINLDVPPQKLEEYIQNQR